jgi:FMN-dependent oxidoreductase (nitrilotriacetate monooxygenase family)
MSQRQMKLGFLTHGAGMTKWMWRQPLLPPDASISFEFYRDLVKLAEKAKFDFFFCTDSPYADADAAPHNMNKLEPMTLLAALASITSDIGLVGTGSTSYSDPFNLARQFGGLDMISKGRAGWNVVTTAVAGAGLNYGLDEAYSHAERYRRATEFIQVVRGLWDSWEDDAFLYDKAHNRFADTSKMHVLDHKGEHFKVRGPLDIRRSPQGQPVIFQAGASGDGQAFASRFADAIFSGTRSHKEAQAYYASVKAQAKALGRTEDILVMCAIGPVVGSTDEEAERMYRELADLVTLEDAIHYMGVTFGGHDFRQYDPDAPFPDLADSVGLEAYQSTAIRFRTFAQEKGLTLRQTAMRIAQPRPQFAGNPEKIADICQEWFEGRACDGFILGLGTPVQGIPNFIELVVPILRQRGLFRTEYEGSTLREHLGIPFAQNRHSRQRETSP